jgi:hypothetical protein
MKHIVGDTTHVAKVSLGEGVPVGPAFGATPGACLCRLESYALGRCWSGRD